MQKLKVDIIAYQDEVGCVRDQFTLPRLKKNWQRLRDIHNRLNIEMWANCETFTWEEGTNDRTSALIPAAYPRLLSQQVAASAAGLIRSFHLCSTVSLRILSQSTNWANLSGRTKCILTIWTGRTERNIGN